MINASLHNVLIVYTYQKKIEKWIETFIDLRAKKKRFPSYNALAEFERKVVHSEQIIKSETNFQFSTGGSVKIHGLRYFGLFVINETRIRMERVNDH